MKNSAFLSGKFALAMFLLVATTLQVAAQDVASDVRKALRLIDIEQSNKVSEAFAALEAKYPTDATVLYYAGYALIKKGELDKANETFDKGIKLNDKEALNYVGKGYVSLLKNNQADSKLQFDKAQSLAKKNAAVLDGIAEAYMSNKQLSGGALDLLLKAKGINAKDPFTLTLLGDAYLQINDGGKAVSSYEDAALADPKDGKPHFKIGMVYNRSKNTEESVKAFTKATTVDPEFAPAFRELGEIYYAKSDGANAVKVGEEYLKLTENKEKAKMQLAFYYFMAKDYTKANDLFKELIGSKDVLPIAYLFYAKSCTELAKFEDAKSAFETYFAKAKKEEITAADYAAYGEALLKLKTQDSLASEAFNWSLTKDSTNVKVMQLKAETYLKRKKYTEAIAAYKKLMAKRTQPMSIDNFSIGKAYFYTNQLVEADTAFSVLVRLQSKMEVGYYWKAKVKVQLDPEQKSGLAKPYFEKVLELGTPDRNKSDMVEACNYLASYCYNIMHDIACTKAYYERILTLKPNDPDILKNLDILKKLEQKKP